MATPEVWSRAVKRKDEVPRHFEDKRQINIKGEGEEITTAFNVR